MYSSKILARMNSISRKRNVAPLPLSYFLICKSLTVNYVGSCSSYAINFHTNKADKYVLICTRKVTDKSTLHLTYIQNVSVVFTVESLVTTRNVLDLSDFNLN